MNNKNYFSDMQNKLAQDISILIRANYPIIYLNTAEEQRALALLGAVEEEVKRRIIRWTVSDGLIDGRKVQQATPEKVLDMILARPGDPEIYVLHDFHFYMNSATVIRRLRDMVTAFRRSRQNLIIISPVLTLPEELEKDITIIEYPLPTPQELLTILEGMVGQAKDKDVEINLSDSDRELLVKGMQGLTGSQAENVLARCMVSDGTLSKNDLAIILREKEQIIKKSGILEFYSSPDSFGDIGGLDELKHWFSKRRHAFTQDAVDFGLPAPKGILLVGVPGCGKSLVAKALAAEWDKPLVRFDVGRIFGGLVGQSEQNMRSALKVAESVAPTILWIDEIEKGFAGIQGGSEGSGVASRVFGTLLTWMQEKEVPVFVVATANDITRLPPELIRKGRFDELFFVDLPFEEEREHIFNIHLSKRDRDPRNFNLPELARLTADFSGAEIEQVIISALFDAYGDRMELTDELLFVSIQQTTPLSRTVHEQIDALRNWAETRCRFASRKVHKSSGQRHIHEISGQFFLDLGGDRVEAARQRSNPLFDS